MTELLPCPFCGTDEPMVMGPTCKRSDPYNPADRLYPTVRCRRCYVDVSGTDGDESCQTAIAAWNRRAPVQASEARGDYAEAMLLLEQQRDLVENLRGRVEDAEAESAENLRIFRELAESVHDRFFWMVSPDDDGNHKVSHESVLAVINLCDEIEQGTPAYENLSAHTQAGPVG